MKRIEKPEPGALSELRSRSLKQVLSPGFAFLEGAAIPFQLKPSELGFLPLTTERVSDNANVKLSKVTRLDGATIETPICLPAKLLC